MLVGSTGQVARECLRRIPMGVEVRAFSHSELDITDGAAVATRVAEFAPQVLINAAAYTAVDKAESDSELAGRVNSDGPGHLAAAVARLDGARMIHLSTDFVFDGCAAQPYTVDAAARPLGVYGATKLSGEQAVRAALGERAAIVRTAWVYSANGNNFLRTMLRLMARGPVRVIADQVGTPTSAGALSEVLWRLVASNLGGTFHWTDAGVASWYDFAVAIAEEAAVARVLPALAEVTPITSAEYPTPARRPGYSVLDKSSTIQRLGVAPKHWRVRLREVIGELQSA